ncbi:uncharacterized protein LOC130143742 [Falco biarmicus]|uniref:uncharacterized protein LOC130143742 n=1 Tax=Falco biarmicus TaxID=345155 RepID=UPI0024BC89B9|nr:uncharacterized protein LOC130143742 [Falco biarmicus]
MSPAFRDCKVLDCYFLGAAMRGDKIATTSLTTWRLVLGLLEQSEADKETKAAVEIATSLFAEMMPNKVPLAPLDSLPPPDSRSQGWQEEQNGARSSGQSQFPLGQQGDPVIVLLPVCDPKPSVIGLSEETSGHVQQPVQMTASGPDPAKFWKKMQEQAPTEEDINAATAMGGRVLACSVLRKDGLCSRLTTQTSGSARLDVTPAAAITIEDDIVHKVPLNAEGPIGNKMSALLLGRSIVTLQGLFVLPGVIDADYMGQIQAIVWPPISPVSIPEGSQIAQLIPFQAQVHYAHDEVRGNEGFGLTGTSQIFWTQSVQKAQPALTCKITFAKGTPVTQVTRMIDMGADVTIISAHIWPCSWPVCSAGSILAGVGGVTQFPKSAYGASSKPSGPDGNNPSL